MAQFARPVSDAYNSDGWTDEAAGSTDIFNSINEETPNDADYVQSPTAPDTAAVVFALGAIEDPQSSSGHVVRFRYQKNASGGAQIDLDVELREGYTDEGSPGTLIASDTLEDIPNGWTDGSINLSAGEADSITDYSDLFIRLVANQV